jgi:uncharacterized membrane protein YkoI
MERYRRPKLPTVEKPNASIRDLEEELREIRAVPAEKQKRQLAKEVVERHERKSRQQARNRKILGGSLSLIGLATTVTSCPLYAMSLTGPELTIAGLVVIVIGGLLILIRPKHKDSTDALMVALKSGNSLTVARLALELDISVERAEKIIRELVSSGIAEIDLDQTDPDDSLVYRIKGL